MTESNYVEFDVTDPRGIVQVYRDFWWWCVAGDPKRAVFYKPRSNRAGSPQCNSSKVVCEHIGAKSSYSEQAQLIQIPLAFVPWEDRQ